MKIELASDTIKHLKGGTLAALALIACVVVANYTHIAVSLFLAGPALGYAVERYQVLRREGTYERRDMINTAIPFWVFAVASLFISP